MPDAGASGRFEDGRRITVDGAKTMSEPTLDDIFNEINSGTTAADDVETEEPETPEPEDETDGENDATGDETEEPETPEPEDEPTPGAKKDDKGDWHLKAVQDERRKRQEAQDRADRLQRELDQLKQPNQPLAEPPKRPDVLDDPEGFASHTEQQFRKELWDTRLALSQDFMRSMHEDYDDREQQFAELVKDPENQHLIGKMVASPNPARFVYDTVVKHERMRDMADPDAYRAKLREELKAELLAEMQAAPTDTGTEEPAPTKKSAPNLARARSARPVTPTPSDDDLKSIFNHQY